MNRQQNPTIHAYMSVEFVKNAMGDSTGPWGVKVSNAEAEAVIRAIVDRWNGLTWSVVFYGSDEADPLCSSDEWWQIVGKAVDSVSATTTRQGKIPVLAAGTDDYMTLVFLTVPHDERGHYAVGWDRFSGHGAVGLDWARRQKRPAPYFAMLELEEYCRRYDVDSSEYEIVDKIERWHSSMRRKTAKEYRMRAHAG